MNLKTLVSGNKNYGLAREIAKRWPQAEFWSRSSNGRDFSAEQTRWDFAERSLDFDLYVSCSSLQQFAQVNLLQTVVEKWIQRRKEGHIIVIGSGADVTTKGNTKTYATEKKALREYCRQIGLMLQSLEQAPRFKLCYLSVGHLNTPAKMERHGNIPHLETGEVVGTMEWILSRPSSLLVSEVSLAPVS